MPKQFIRRISSTIGYILDDIGECIRNDSDHDDDSDEENDAGGETLFNVLATERTGFLFTRVTETSIVGVRHLETGGSTGSLQVSLGS